MTTTSATLDKTDDQFDDEFLIPIAYKFLEVFGPDDALDALDTIGICVAHGSECPKIPLYKLFTTIQACMAKEKAAP